MENDYEEFVKDTLERYVIGYWIESCKAFGMDWREYPRVYFVETTAKAGEARFKISEMGIMTEYGIELNLELACESNENLSEFFNQVIPHEVCHLIANRFWGKNCGHGIEWQATMIKMGKNPARTHSMNVVNVSNKTYEYKCPDCGQKFHFAKAKHLRVQEGQSRYCGVCHSKHALVFVKNHEIVQLDEF